MVHIYLIIVGILTSSQKNYALTHMASMVSALYMWL